VEHPRTDACDAVPSSQIYSTQSPEGYLETLGTYGGEMIRLVHGTAHHPHGFPFSPCTSAGLQPLQHRVALFNGHICTAMCVGATP
jgi:hypothetical protein